MSVGPAKTQISWGIRPDRSGSSLCAQWVAKDPKFLHADSEDSDQTGRMPRLIWVFAGRTLTLLALSCCGSHYFRHWQLPYLNQRKGENGRRHYFITNLHESYAARSRSLCFLYIRSYFQRKQTQTEKLHHMRIFSFSWLPEIKFEIWNVTFTTEI